MNVSVSGEPTIQHKLLDKTCGNRSAVVIRMYKCNNHQQCPCHTELFDNICLKVPKILHWLAAEILVRVNKFAGKFGCHTQTLDMIEQCTRAAKDSRASGYLTKNSKQPLMYGLQARTTLNSSACPLIVEKKWPLLNL
jgi:hypothetical protein